MLRSGARKTRLSFVESKEDRNKAMIVLRSRDGSRPNRINATPNKSFDATELSLILIVWIRGGTKINLEKHPVTSEKMTQHYDALLPTVRETLQQF